MSFTHLYGLDKVPDEIPYFERFASRTKTIETIDQGRFWDVVIVGGGIHGVAMAHLAAVIGLKTVLLEQRDYAWATSGRSSKMIHGGLRYLELFDFQQVFEGIRARDRLFASAEHVVHPQEFLIPVKNLWERIKFGCGLTIYDFLNRNSARKHSWKKPADLSATGFAGQSLNGAYSYFDGATDDVRLTLEHLVAARQEGAHCLNYAALENYRKREDGAVIVAWNDRVTNTKHELKAGVIINCAGPWVPNVGRISAGPLAARIKYSRGTHLLFSVPWKGPSLTLPMGQKNRVYFVWPHEGGTRVGTTEREVDTMENDPQPTLGEVEELLGYLKRDLPESGLDRTSLYYGYAGVRTLPLKPGSSAGSAQLSRKHHWIYSEGMMSLVGGKLTTHAWTVYEGLKEVLRLAHRPIELSPADLRSLPGSAAYESRIAEFYLAANENSVPNAVAKECVRRIGGRAVHLINRPRAWELVSGRFLRGEIEMAIVVDQARTLEDLMSRRLGLELLPGHGLEAISEIGKVLSELVPGQDLAAQEAGYREKIKSIRNLMSLPT